MKPLMTEKITISKDGRWLISRTIITTILPSDYYRALLANAIKADEQELSDEAIKELVNAERGK